MRYFIFFLIFLSHSVLSNEIEPPTKLIIKINKDFDKTSLKKFNKLSIKDLFPLDNYKIVEGNFGENREDILSEISKIVGVEAIVLDKKLDFREIPNDIFYEDKQWGHDKVNAPEAWDITTGGLTKNGDTIVVAVLDNGIDINHSDLKNIIWHNRFEIADDGIDNDENGYIDDVLAWNFKNNSNIHPSEKHGTKVAGVIGAEGNNANGIAGVNWNIKIMLLTVSTIYEMVEGFGYAYEQRKRYNDSSGAEGAFIVVCSSSLGTSIFTQDQKELWCEMYNKMGEIGIISVGATTNSNTNVSEEEDLPSSCQSEYLIVVTNSNKYDEKYVEAGYSTKNVDLSAPGTNIFSTTVNNDYASATGTSLSTPFVSGAVALLYSLPTDTLTDIINMNPALTGLTIKSAILDGVERNSNLEAYTKSGGRLDLMGAIKSFKKHISIELPENAAIVRPNPTSNSLEIYYNVYTDSEYQLDILDISGKTIISKTLTPSRFIVNKTIIDVHHLPVGVYIVHIQKGREVINVKFVKM